MRTGRAGVSLASPNVHDKTLENEVLKDSLPVMVHCTATWSGPCKALATLIDKIADDYQGKLKVAA